MREAIIPSTHCCLHYHLIFSTKGRYPFIGTSWRERLHAYLGGSVRTLGGVAVFIGGTADHVHLLVSLNPTHCLADLLRETKRSSSAWVHEKLGIAKFAWQEGYGAFTVSPTQIEVVKRYIAHQEMHHRKQTFQEEYVALLGKSRIEFDDRYLW